MTTIFIIFQNQAVYGSLLIPPQILSPFCGEALKSFKRVYTLFFEVGTNFSSVKMNTSEYNQISYYFLLFRHTTLFNTRSSLGLHSVFTRSSLGLHSVFTRSSLGLHSVFTRSSLGLHSVFTRSSLGLHSVFTRSSLGLHSVFTRSSLGLHSVFTRSSLDLHSDFT